MSTVCPLFKQCVSAIRQNVFIERMNVGDKEFHFQNWFEARLNDLGESHDRPSRNTYPDFRLVRHAEGYELKGLAYPGRHANFDCNSRPPCGEHNDRRIFYVFGRYPANPDGDLYPVLDLVMCHGDFLNADNMYFHENKSFRGFGAYGDILVRDRKMYVAPTPFALADGTAHHRTLILPNHMPVDDDLIEVATLVRREVDHVVISYHFDMRANELKTEFAPNPNMGREHAFKAYRLKGDPLGAVTLAEHSR